ncbi:MAG TPA: response regulator [Candidatus Nitrosotalea sp.]|nr:response regulator [Nitrososphaerota archaeon]HKU32615.1 response regulator [Candidatus Nitrosotalea sp.]
MEVLIADDESDLLDQYRFALEAKGHNVISCNDGEQCLRIYMIESEQQHKDNFSTPFDVVVLDYQMPKANGIEVAKQILAVNSHQRIIFASGYVHETFLDSIKQLGQITEIMKKPFSLQALVDTIEDKEIYNQLEKLNVDVSAIKELNPSHAQIKAYFDVLCRLQKGRTF